MTAKTNYKRMMGLILSLVLALGAFAGCSGANQSSNEDNSGASQINGGTNTEDSEKDLLARIKESGVITIATEGDWSPWTYHDESGELVGLDIEIGKLIAEGLGVEAKFEETTWDSILAGVQSGRFDIACNGVGYTEERAESFHFSDPYVYTHKVLVVRGDNEDITSFEDLNGKTTANTASSTYAALAESYGATVTPVDSLTDTIELVSMGRVDATINAQVSILDYLEEHPDANIKIVAIADGDPVCYPVQKSDDALSLIQEVNRILEENRQNGKLAEISIKYFGVDLTEEN
ncbi:MAG: transporter substrate-binding domain-containing protein [Lachnospiraceae bacterium]|nr:transporter substrate-binding domain-containing protein [Lachnospiraceae bacterium]